MDPGAKVRARIAAEDARNKTLPLSVQAQHLRELDEVLRGIIVGTMHPYALSGLAERAIAQGLPINSSILFAPETTLKIEARFIALCRPALANLHKECRAYLAHKMKRREQDIEGTVSYNLVLGGTPVNPSGM